MLTRLSSSTVPHSCVGLPPSTTRRTPRVSIPQIFTLLVFAVALCAPVSGLAQKKKAALGDGPKTIASRDRVSVIIDREVSDGKKYIILKISVPTDSQVKAFLLPDPPRVVVDFEGASIKKSEEFPAPSNDVIKKVRLGAHPSKLRCVLDMQRSTPPVYEWKAGKRQAILKFLEGPAAAATAPAAVPTSPTAAAPAGAPAAAPSAVVPAPVLPTTSAPAAVSPTVVPTIPPTAVPATVVPTIAATAPPATTPPPPGTASDPKAAANAAATQAKQPPVVLGDFDSEAPQPKVPTTFSIKGYKFEYLPDKTPALKIVLNKPRAQAQISKVDQETYKIEIKDCGIDNEDLELPQFPPHDFIGFVMVVAETVGKNTEVSISIEEDIVLGTSVHENEIWIKKP